MSKTEDKSSLPAYRDCSRISLTATHVEQFEREGYTVVDGFFGSEWAQRLLADARRLAKEGHLLQHRFQFGQALYEKPNIFELDFDNEQRWALSEELSFIHNIAGPKLVEAANKALPGLKLGQSQAIKLQWNRGQGGCFPWHYDNPGPPSRRRLTCIWYMNPDWQPTHGGQLALWPFVGAPVAIPPKMDRLVLFRSDLMLHRVLQSEHERFCFTIWVDGLEVNRDEDVLLTRDNLQFTSWDVAVRTFQRSPLQRVISRAVYHEDYEKSLVECVAAAALREMINAHKGNVKQMTDKLGPLIVEVRNRQAQIGSNLIDFDDDDGEVADGLDSMLDFLT